MSLRKVLGALRQADEDFRLIEDGDRIAVGISGGKDSIVLLYALSIYQRFANKNFEIVGIHIDLGFGNMDFQPTADFCKEHQISYVEYPSDVYEILKQNLRKNGMLEQQLRTGKSHNFFGPLLVSFPIAVDIAFCADGLLLSERTASQSFHGI